MPTPSLMRRASVVAAGLVAAALLTPPIASAAPATPLTGVVRGTVTAVGPDGATVPVGGVVVRVATGTDTTTDARGRYRTTALAFDAITVCFFVPPAVQTLTDAGFTSHCNGVNAPLADSTGTPVAVAAGATVVVDDVLPPAAGIRGTLVDAGGAPVAGAAVTISNDADVPQTVSAADGSFVTRGAFPGSSQVCVSPGSSPATATDPGIARTCVPATGVAGQVTDVAVHVPAGGGVKGAVRDANGAAVDDATVRSDDGSTTHTAMDGTFLLGHLTKGTAHVCVTPPPAANLLSTCTDVTVRDGKYTASPITLPTAAAVTGVIDDTLGDPLSGVDVLVYGSGGTLTVTTGSDGRYRVAGVTPSTVSICFAPRQTVAGGSSANGYRPTCRKGVTLPAGSTTLSPALVSSGAFAGQVVDETGRAVADAQVTASQFVAEGAVAQSGATTSDAAGNFLIRNLGPGDFNVEASHAAPGFGAAAGYFASPADNEFAIKGTRTVAVTGLTLTRASGIDLLVTGPSGEALPAVDVVASTAGGPGTSNSGSDLNGRAIFTLAGGRTYRLCAQAVSARPGYPDGLSGRCTNVTTKVAAVVRHTISLPLKAS